MVPLPPSGYDIRLAVLEGCSSTGGVGKPTRWLLGLLAIVLFSGCDQVIDPDVLKPPYDEHKVIDVNTAIVAIIEAEAGNATQSRSEENGHLCRVGLSKRPDGVAEQMTSSWQLGEDHMLGLSLLDQVASYLASRPDTDIVERRPTRNNGRQDGLSASGNGFTVYTGVTMRNDGLITLTVYTHGPCH